MTSHAINRGQFLFLLLEEDSESSILEIGSLSRPLVTTSKTKYFDLHSTEELKKKATSEGLDPETVPNIHFSDPQGNLGVINEKFNNIVSVHCI